MNLADANSTKQSVKL